METWQTAIRIPIDLYEKIKADAEKERRSISQQINIIVQKHYDLKEQFK